jgi:hypothetical protein
MKKAVSSSEMWSISTRLHGATSQKTAIFVVRFEVLTAASMKMAVFWVVALMMEAARTTETSVKSYQSTRRNNQKTAIVILATVRNSNLTCNL